MKVNKTIISLKEINKEKVLASFESNGKKPVINGWRIITYQQSDSVTLQWFIDFTLRWYPWEKFSSLLYEKMYGTQMEQGLTILKQIAEGK